MQTAIKTIAVIGASKNGRALAEALLRADYRIILEDVIETRLREVARSLTELGLESDARITMANTVEEALPGADLVIETVADELEMKLELFTLFDKFAKPDAILASTRESIPIADLAEMTACPERCIGFRFVAANSVELRCSPRTSVETIVACGELARRLGREVAIIPDDSRSRGPQTM